MKKLTLFLLSFLLFLFSLPLPLVSAAGYSLNKTKVTLEAGNVTSLYLVGINGAYDSVGNKVTFQSSNEAVARIDENGSLSAIKEGSAIITAVYKKVRYTCAVTVKTSRYRLNFLKLNMNTGEDRELSISQIDERVTDVQCIIMDADTNATVTNGFSFEIKNNKIKLRALKSGSYTLKILVSATELSGKSNTYTDTAAIAVSTAGVEEAALAIAVGATKKLTLGEGDFQFTSSDKNVAAVNKNGKITAKTAGDAVITAVLTHPDLTQTIYETFVKVTDPMVSFSKTTLQKGEALLFMVTGTDDTLSVIKPSCTGGGKILSYYAWGDVFFAKGAGTATVTVNADGRKFTQEITVIDPFSTRSTYNLAVGKPEQLTLKGLPPDMKPSGYSVSNKEVLQVSGKGLITAKKAGNSMITVAFKDFKLYVPVSVSSQRASAAVTVGRKLLGAPYSQDYRMKNGYFDCSSFVWYAYKQGGLSLGSSSSAPTAANLAKLLNEQNKVIAKSAIGIDKLLPGDLIFYSSRSNGRYLNIGHVSMYSGSIAYYDTFSESVVTKGLILESVYKGVSENQYVEDDSSVVMIARPAK